jgi:predicted CXXCH cytochrome family protein
MMPKQLQALGNIQCENCHGPGSEHAYSLGDPTKISASFMTGDCAQCHDSKPQHVRNIEWNASRHAVAVEETEPGCARCHAAKGYANYIAGSTPVAVPYEVITCSTCHDPHDATNPHQLRTLKSVTLMDKKTTITEGGTGLMCMNCHMTRRDATNYVEVTVASSRFGPHYGAQADMLAGANAVTYGKTIGSTAHLSVVEDSCATCHMQATAMADPAYLKAGGHTFSMSAQTTNGVVQLLGACQECHGKITSFDFPRQDYDGDGIVEGVQTEVRHLLDRLALMLPPVGTPKTSLSINTNWTRQQLRASYNWQFVKNDGSYGIHNLSYAVGLLKASIADVSGDANSDGLADWWQIQYFGSLSNPQAHPNATPAGDGVPNWLKFGLGLNPLTPGATLPDGVAWANGGTVGGAGSSPVQIYTAAEVVFNTETGKTYQMQAISSLGEGWKNIGGPVTGTGAAMSFVTPTRTSQQQFYRVVVTP